MSSDEMSLERRERHHRPEHIRNVSDQLGAKIATAAKLRACGLLWREIAEKLDYANADSASRNCKQLYPTIWDKEFSDAVRKHTHELEAEALFTQQMLMQGRESKDAKIKGVAQQAADSVMKHAAKTRGSMMRLDVEVTAKADERLLERTSRQANEHAARLVEQGGPGVAADQAAGDAWRAIGPDSTEREPGTPEVLADGGDPKP